MPQGMTEEIGGTNERHHNYYNLLVLVIRMVKNLFVP